MSGRDAHHDGGQDERIVQQKIFGKPTASGGRKRGMQVPPMEMDVEEFMLLGLVIKPLCCNFDAPVDKNSKVPEYTVIEGDGEDSQATDGSDKWAFLSLKSTQRSASKAMVAIAVQQPADTLAGTVSKGGPVVLNGPKALFLPHVPCTSAEEESASPPSPFPVSSSHASPRNQRRDAEAGHCEEISKASQSDSVKIFKGLRLRIDAAHRDKGRGLGVGGGKVMRLFLTPSHLPFIRQIFSSSIHPSINQSTDL